MPRGRPRTKNLARGRPSSKITIDRKPIRPLERQRMRPWLLELLDSNSCTQLVWACKEMNMFRVAWKHAAGQTFDPRADATLFELWARHTGKYYTGDKPDPKKWKANFRCALNSLQDVEEDKAQGVRKGNNAFKVYKFLDEKKQKKPTPKKTKESDDEECDEIAVLRNMGTTGTKSRPKINSRPFYDSEGSEGINSPVSDSGQSDWDERTSDDFRCREQEMECEKSPLPDFDQLWHPATMLGINKRSCQRERLSESHYPERQPEAFSPQRSTEYSHSPQYVADSPPYVTDSPQYVTEIDEESSNSSSCPTEQEMAETIQFQDFDETEFLNGYFNPCFIIEGAPEEIIEADCEYPSQDSSPNVIVLPEEGLCADYMYTSMSEL